MPRLTPHANRIPLKLLPRLLTLATGGLFLVLSSCKVGPNYQRPPIETPLNFKSATTRPTTQPTPRLGQNWWQLFNDPNLTKLEQVADVSNLNLQAAMARVAEARAASQSTRSQLFPNLSLNPSITRARASAGRNGQASTATVTQVPLDLSYEIDIWGRVRRSYDASKAQLQASIYDVEVVRQTLQADVATNYFAIRALDSQIQIIDRNVVLYQRQVDLTQRQFDVGLVSQTDVLQAKTLLNSTTAQGIEFRRQRADLEHALAVLLGRPPSDLFVDFSPLDLTPPVIPPGLPSELLKRRPDVAEAEENLKAANEQIGVATANFYPVVRLTGAAGFESIDLQHAVDWQSRIWSLGPSVSIPIFEGGQLIANLKQTKARYDELQANYRTTILNAYRDVEDSLTDIHHQADELEAQNRAVTSARALVQLANTQYRQGLTSYLQVIDAERSLLLNELSAVQTANQRLAATVLLIKAIGGGWEVPTTTQPTTPPATRTASTNPH